MAKRGCKFSSDLETEFPFLKRIKGEESKVECQQCKSQFSVFHGGRNDITSHLSTERHKSAIKVIAGSKGIASFFRSSMPNQQDFEIAAAEATFAYHTVQHNQSFKSNDCTSNLLKQIFNVKYCASRTKCEAIAIQIIAPYIQNFINSELEKAQCIAVSTDTSNHKEIKLVPVIVRYFIPTKGVRVKLLDFYSVPGETSEIMVNKLEECLSVKGLLPKLVCFCADNTNANFGGMKRRGQCNIFTKLKERCGKQLLGIGCGAHIVHNALQTAVDILPIEIESILVKIYKHFYIYTVRVEKLKEFCNFADHEYKRLLKHGSTRFLSMGKALDRCLQLYAGLKSYFLSTEGCPTVLVNFFNNDCSELWFLFVHGQLPLFEDTILSIEKQDIDACAVANKMLLLNKKLRTRKQEKFIPFAADNLLHKCINDGIIKREKFEQNVEQFYDYSIKYLDEWQTSFENAELFSWSDLNGDVNWQDVKSSALFINDKLGRQEIIIDQLFDEVTIIKDIIESYIENWKANCTTKQDRWVAIFTFTTDKMISIKNVQYMMEYILALPGTSAPVERIFSITNDIWTDERNSLHESTVKAMLIIKQNSEMSCTQFYNDIKRDKSLLSKVHSSEKYN